MFRCVKIILLLVFSLLGGGASYAQTGKKDLEQQRKKLQEEITQTQKLIQETKKNKSLSLSQLKVLNKKIEDRKKLIAAIQNEISFLNTSIVSDDQQINELRVKIKQLKGHYAKMLRRAYMEQNKQSIMLLIFSSKDIHQAYKRLQYVKTFNEYLKQEARKIMDCETTLNNHVEAMRVNLSDKRNLLGSEELEKKELNQEKTEQEKTILELKKKEGKLKKDLAKKQSDQRKLNNEIQRIIEREIAKEKELALKKSSTTKVRPAEKSENKSPKKEEKVAKTEAEPRVTPETKLVSGKFESNKGRLPWPVSSGVITESFGSHPHPVLKNVTTFNNGIDIGTSRGALVKTIFDGEVSGTISVPGANNAIIIRHGEYLTVYSNLESVNVKRGDKVSRGQSIGVVATDSAEGKTEAHMEIWKGKTKLNPAEWIAR